MARLKLEKWRSTAKSEEHHYFLDHADREVYVVGFNPAVLPAAVRRRVLALVGGHLDSCYGRAVRKASERTAR